MKFFESEVVRAELAEISELQEQIYTNVFKFPSMSKEEKLEHVDVLERLLDKQKVLYTRLSLSDDPDAKEMKQRISESATLMGLPEDVDMNIFFRDMTETVKIMRERIDNTGSDQ